MSSWDGRRRRDQRRFGIVFRNIVAGVPAIAAMFISSGARNKEERTFKWTNSDWGGIGLRSSVLRDFSTSEVRLSRRSLRSLFLKSGLSQGFGLKAAEAWLGT